MDSILINTPVSSPLHPQANLPLLKEYLASKGYETKIIDSNILFFHWFLGENNFHLTMNEVYKNPLKILSFYNEIERKLWEKSKAFKGLSVGMRYLDMKYDRTSFEFVIKSLEGRESNPFIDFYNNLIDEHLSGIGARICGIAITFQDQIISAFTLASLLRKRMPEIKIVMGGQMVTRCHDTMISDKEICKYFDYLALWDGEEPMLDILHKEIRGKDVKFINVIDVNNDAHNIDRLAKAPGPEDIPSPDFSDINFNGYFFPDMLVPIQTTRGCYGSCEFCAIPFGSNKYRMRPAKKIIADITKVQEETRQRYGKKATLFKFMEDTSSPALLYEISKEIEKRGLDVKWETFARLEKAFTKNGFMEQLFKGGCRKIHWGLESNNPDVLKNMNKKTDAAYADAVLELSAKAGILNFCFVLIGFPGETKAVREQLVRYIIENENIHTITVTTFDLTRKAPMQQNFVKDNPYGLEMMPAEGFQVRLPYMINGENWKEKIVGDAHALMLAVIKERPDIGFMSLFPDQIRSLYCDKFTNKWGQVFLDKYGETNIRDMLLNTEKYIDAYRNKREIDPDFLPEPLRREHFRTKEDINLITSAVVARKKYEQRRVDQV